MINIIREILYKLFREPDKVHEVKLRDPDRTAYSEMIANDLESKYEGKVFNVPVQLINFDALLESLVASGHPAIQDKVTKPYVPEDFGDLPDEIAELITDYMNTHLKLLVNAVIQEYLDQDKIKMSVDDHGIKYYTDGEDEDIDGLIELERGFRSI